MKINLLTNDGFYIEDFIIGFSGDIETNQLWTSDLVENGYFKAQYQKFIKDDSTGECIGGEWVETGTAPSPDYVKIAEYKKTRLYNIVTTLIAPLQDAVDIDEATTEEIERLKVLKTYRVQLNRVDTSLAPDIVWPTKPDGIE